VYHLLALLLVLFLCACGGAPTEPVAAPAAEPQASPDPGDPRDAPQGGELAQDPPDAQPASPQSSGDCTQDSDCPAGSRCVEAVPIAAVGEPLPKRCLSESGGPPVAPDAPAPEPQP